MQELQSELVHVSRLTAMGEMASSLAHELNQPLSAITSYLRGASTLLKTGQPDKGRVRESLDRSAEQALRAGDVIKRLREFVAKGETEHTIEDPLHCLRKPRHSLWLAPGSRACVCHSGAIAVFLMLWLIRYRSSKLHST